MTAYSPIETGAVLAGKYRVDRVLGQGGMGIVVQAMHLQLHQPVAMKFLLYLTAPRAQERATARVVPVVHDGGVGLAIAGGF